MNKHVGDLQHIPSTRDRRRFESSSPSRNCLTGGGDGGFAAAALSSFLSDGIDVGDGTGGGAPVDGGEKEQA